MNPISGSSIAKKSIHLPSFPRGHGYPVSHDLLLIIAPLRKILPNSDFGGEKSGHSCDLMVWQESKLKIANASNPTKAAEPIMSMTNTHFDASHVSSPEEFVELCTYAAELGLPSTTQSPGNPTEIGFMIMLLTRFHVWVEETGNAFEVIHSVEYLLTSVALRTELASIAFKHRTPTASQIDTTLRLLFQAAACRHKLVTTAAAKRELNSWVDKA